MRQILALALALFFAVPTLGQTNRGGISGIVFDSTGAVIPLAAVTITNLGTNQKVTLKTSEAGAYTATSLEPVTYSVTVEAVGFKKAVIQNVKVDTSTTATVNVTLEPGTIDNVVSVTAEAPVLNAQTGTTTHTITERQIRDVPLLNRSVLDLALTAPNVTGDAGSEDPEVTSGQPVPGFNLSLNGGRPGSTSILADGINNTGVGIARAVVSFTPETVQEFTVQTSAYSAEFGQTGGGVINATTKSGTNDFNGVALWYTRNPVTNARPWRIGTGPRPANNLRYNQFSLTLGGPVFLPKIYDGRNRTFFFFAYEPRWRRDFLSQSTILPAAAERAGDFSNLVRTSSGWLPADVAARFNLTSVGPTTIYQQFNQVNGKLVPIVLATGQTFQPFPGNKIPTSMIDPTALKVLELMPKGGDYFIDDAGLVRNYLVNRFVKQDETRYTVRVDHSIAAANKASFRLTVTPAVGIRGFGSDVNGNTAAYSDAKQIVVADNHIFSPSVINDLRLSYTRGVFSEDFSPEFSIKGGRNLANELGLPSLTTGGIPLFQISADGNGYNAFSDVGSSGSTNNFNVEERFNINDIVYWTKGNMAWKFGADLGYARLNVIPFFAASGGRWAFRIVNTSNNRATGLTNGGNPLASLLLGVPNTVDVRPLLLNYDYRWKSAAGFVQNDWKARQNLTLNLGFRYSLQYPRYEKNNLQGVFRPDLAQTVTLTDAQRRATATGLGVPTNSPIPSYVPTTVAIPPFAFAGRGGRSRYIVPVDYKGLEPRFGFAYSPKMFAWMEKRNAVIRGGYGLSHAPLTGNNRSPNPDFGAFTTVSTLANGSTAGGTADATQPIRLSGNPVLVQGRPIEQQLSISPDGLVYLNSLGIPGVADAGAGSGKVPYSQNWNLAVQIELFRGTLVEVAYVGNKGTHLYMPLVNINPRDTDFVEFLEANNLPAENTFADPLGRTNLLGAVIAIQRNSVTTPYFGFNNLNRFFDPSANSIRHAGYIDVRRRVGRGLTFTANYTYGKSIDDASDASPDTRVLTTYNTQGQVSYGAPRKSDRAISTFDIKHNFSSTAIYDLPFGRGRRFLTNAWLPVQLVAGGWSVTSVLRLQGGYPFLPFITDTNRLGGVNRTVRLDIVPGQPLKNPRWNPNCPVGNLCEPFVNPAAFIRPVKGALGNAPRTIDLRAPSQEYFDLSIQKDFPLPFFGKEGKRRINFRMDMLNAFNHPNFRYNQNGNTPPGFGGLPTELTAENETVNGVSRPAVITAAEYNAWAAFNGITPSTAQLNQIRAMVNAQRLSSNALPLDFFHTAVPAGFATTNLNAFDIRTLEGFKLYRLRQAYDTNFGTLREVAQPRYIQFGIRIFF
jgi:hypothetical protein